MITCVDATGSPPLVSAVPAAASMDELHGSLLFCLVVFWFVLRGFIRLMNYNS
jgi:hypothetical protein